MAAPVLHKVDEACAMLRIGPTTYYELVKRGIIKPVKIGKKGVRVPDSEVQAVPERLRAEGAA